MVEQRKFRSSLAMIAGRYGDRVLHTFPHRKGKVAFVENKPLDLGHVAELLAH